MAERLETRLLLDAVVSPFVEDLLRGFYADPGHIVLDVRDEQESVRRLLDSSGLWTGSGDGASGTTQPEETASSAVSVLRPLPPDPVAQVPRPSMPPVRGGLAAAGSGVSAARNETLEQPDSDATGDDHSNGTPGALPNLVVTALDAPESIEPGSRHAITWTVTNRGAGAATLDGWHDYVVFSKDQAVGTDDVYLTSRWTTEHAPLGPGESYTYTRTIEIPSYVRGEGHIVVHADRWNRLAETEDSDNASSVRTRAPGFAGEPDGGSGGRSSTRETYEFDGTEAGWIEDGLEGLADLASSLETEGEFSEPMTFLSNSDADAVSPGELVDLGGLVQSRLTDRVGSYFDGDATPTSDELIGELATFSADFDAVSGGYFAEDNEVRVRVEASFEVSALATPFDLGPEGDALGLEVDSIAAEAPVEATVQLDLWFGIKLDADANAEDAFFVREEPDTPFLTASLDVHTELIGFPLDVGFLGIEVVGGSMDLDVDLEVGLLNPDGDADDCVTLAELAGYSIGSLVSVTVTSSTLDASFPTVVSDDLFAPGGSPEIVLTDDPLDPTDPQLSLTDFEDLSEFTLFSETSVLDELSVLSSWMSSFSRSRVLDVSIPFVDGVSIGDAADLGAALEQRVTAALRTDGEAAFGNAQQLGEQLATILGVDISDINPRYDTTSDELRYDVDFAGESLGSFEANPAVPDAGALSGTTVDLDDPSSDPALIEGVATSEMTVGLSMTPLSGDETLSDRAFVQSVSWDVDAIQTIQSFVSEAVWGIVGVDSGEASGGGTASASVQIESEAGEPQVTIAELVENTATPEDLVVGGEPTLTGDFELLLESISVQTGISIPTGLDPAIGLEVTDLTDPVFNVVEYNLDKLSDVANFTKDHLVETIGLVKSLSFEHVRNVLDTTVDAVGAITDTVTDIATLPLELADALDGIDYSGTLQEFETRVDEALGALGDASVAFNDVLDSVEVSIDATLTTMGTLPVAIDLTGLSDLAGASGYAGAGQLTEVDGDASVDVSVEASFHVDAGVDVSAPETPTPFLYDTSSLNTEVEATGSGLHFGAALGALGVFIGDGASDNGSLSLSDGSGGGASFVVSMIDDSADDGRYLGSELGIDILESSISGEFTANLPLYFPTTADLVGDLVIDIPDLSDIPGSISLTGPDLDSLIASIDLFSNLDSVIDSLDALLAFVQDALDGEVYGVNLPVIGTGLAPVGDLIGEFRSEIRLALEAELSFGTLTPSVVVDAINTALGDLGLLITAADYEEFDFDTDGAGDRVEFTVSLGRDVLAASETIDFDTGLPALGLEITGDVSVELGWSLDLTFGVDRDWGGYFNNSAADEMSIEMWAGPSGGFAATGSLGFLQLSATDNGSYFGGETIDDNAAFAIDLLDGGTSGAGEDAGILTFAEALSIGSFASVVSASLTAHSRIDLELELAADSDGNFPSLCATLAVDWSFDDALEGNEPTVSYEGLCLNMGSYFSDLIGPFLERIDHVLQPLRPILDVLTAPLPVISDLRGDTSLLDIFGSGEPSFVQVIDLVATLDDIVGGLSIGDDVVIDLGSLDFDIDLRSFDGVDDLTFDAGWWDSSGFDPWSEIDSGAGSEFGQTVGEINTVAETDLSFPIFEGAGGSGIPEALLLLLGQDASLVEFSLPELSVEGSIRRSFPLPPPLSFLAVSLEGGLGARAQLAFGYDTAGIRAFADGGYSDPAALADGFFVRDLEGSEFEIYGFVEVGFGLDVVVVRGEIVGGIEATLGADLNDQDGDGKLRGAQIVELLNLGGLHCLFDFEGKVDGYLELEAKVGLCPTCYEYSYEIGRVTLWSNTWEADCDDLPTGPPDLVRVVDETELHLNMGPDAKLRGTFNVYDGDEYFYVREGSSGGIVVEAFGFTSDEYLGITTVFADAGEGDDIIELEDGLAVAVNLIGGDGNDVLEGSQFADEIVGGDGNDTIYGRRGDDPVLLGGNGDDVIFGGDGDDTIAGGEGDDKLYGGDGADEIRGDAGADYLYGWVGASDEDDTDGGDTLSGGEGADVIHGQGGADTIDGDGGADSIWGGTGGDTIDGGTEDDFLWGEDDGDEIRGGDGDDYLNGDLGTDQLYGEVGNDTLIGGNGPDSMFGGDGDDDITGGFGTDTIHGQAGNDTIEGNEGDDDIFGGAGWDTIDANAGNDYVDGGANPDVIRTHGGADEVHGGGGQDVIDTAGGDDEIHGGDHRDTITAGSGDDTIWGDEGPDRIRGQEGEDTIYGGVGADRLYGDGDSDRIFGEADADQIFGGSGRDSLRGGTENDTIHGQGGLDLILGQDDDDTLYGGSDDDVLYGEHGNDAISGDGGDDRVFGGDGDDSLSGGDDNDALDGEDGNDALDGGAGDDVLLGGMGVNSLAGGPGNDSLTVGGDFGGTIDGGPGDDHITGTDAGTQDPDWTDGTYFGDVITGGEGNDTILGLGGADLIDAGPGDDWVNGGMQGDYILGGEGQDFLYAGLSIADQLYGDGGDDVIYGSYLGTDLIEGGDGDDQAYGQGGDDALNGGAGDDSLDGGAGEDVILGGDDDDTIYGGGGADTLRGEGGHDLIHGSDDAADDIEGGPGDDFIYGNAGNDELHGGPGNDTIDGGAGDDRIFGERGSDVLVGGADHDVLYAFAPTGTDDRRPDALYGDLGDDDHGFTDAGRDQLFGDRGNDLLHGEGEDDQIDPGASSGDLIDFGEGRTSPEPYTTPSPTPDPSLDPGSIVRFEHGDVRFPSAASGRWSEFGGSATGGGVSESQGIEQSIATDPFGNVYMAWADTRNGNYEIYVGAYDPVTELWTDLGGSLEYGGISRTATQSRRPSISVIEMGGAYLPMVAWTEFDGAGAGGQSNIWFASYDFTAGVWQGLVGSDAPMGVSGTGLADHAQVVPYAMAPTGDHVPVIAWSDTTTTGLAQVRVAQYDTTTTNWTGISAGEPTFGFSPEVAEFSLSGGYACDALTLTWRDEGGGQIKLLWFGCNIWEELTDSITFTSSADAGISNETGNSLSPTSATGPIVAYREDDGYSSQIFVRHWVLDDPLDFRNGHWEAAALGSDSGDGISSSPDFALSPVLADGADGHIAWLDESFQSDDSALASIYAATWNPMGSGGAGSFDPEYQSDVVHRGISETGGRVLSLAMAGDAGNEYVSWLEATPEGPRVYARGDQGDLTDVYFVNDANQDGDVFATAPGDPGNTGTSPDSPLQSIDAVLGAHSPAAGSTILVDTGEYVEPVNVVGPLDDLRIVGSPEGSHIAGLVSVNGATNITFDVMRFEQAVMVTGGDRLHLLNSHLAGQLQISDGTNLIVSNNTFDLSNVAGGFGLAMSSGTSAQVLANTFAGDDSSDVGLRIDDDSTTGEIRANDFGALGIALQLNGRYGGSILGNVISGNDVGVEINAHAILAANEITQNIIGVRVATADDDGLEAARPEDANLIENNDVGVELSSGFVAGQRIAGNVIGVSGPGGRLGGLDADSANVVELNDVGVMFGGDVQYNLIRGNTVGIDALSHQNITHNVIDDNTVVGVDVNNAVDVRLVSNTVRARTGDAVRVQAGSSEVQLHNNIIWAGQGTGIALDDSSRSGLASDYNNLFATQTGTITTAGKSYADILDWQIEFEGLDAHSIGTTGPLPFGSRPWFEDPTRSRFGLVDIAAGRRITNLSMDSGIPAIDVGVDPAMNLISNPGFEPDLTGWTTNGTADSGSAEYTAFEGDTYFRPGADATGFAEQSIDVSSHATEIDAQDAVVAFGARFRADAGNMPDTASVRVVFRAGDSSVISDVDLPVQITDDRWLLVADREAVPALTRSVDVRLETNTGASTNGGFFDSSFLYVLSEGVGADMGASGWTAADLDGDESLPMHVAIRSPDHYTDWPADVTRAIRWDTYGNAEEREVRIDLYQDSALSGPELLLTIAPSTTDDGEFEWAPSDSGVTAGTLGLRIQISVADDGMTPPNFTVLDRGLEHFSVPETGNDYFVDDGDDTDDEYTPGVIGDNRATGKTASSPKANPLAILASYDLEAAATLSIDTGNYELGSSVTMTGAGFLLRGPSDGSLVASLHMPAGVDPVLEFAGAVAPLVRDLSVSGGAAGLHVTDATTGASIERLTVGNGAGSGVLLDGASQIDLFDGVAAQGRAGSGVRVDDAIVNGITGLAADGNAIGLSLVAGSIGQISDSSFDANGIGLLLEAETNVRTSVISNNQVGLRSTASEGPLTVTNTLFFGNSLMGIELVGNGTAGSFSAAIVNSTVHQQTGVGVRAEDTQNVELRNNIIWAEGDAALSVAPNARAGFASEYNLLRATGTAAVGQWGTRRLDLGRWRQFSGQDTYSFSSDPQFADVVNGDYHLRSTAGRWDPSLGSFVTDAVQSPAIDRGDAADAFGNETANNGGYINLGAYGNTTQASRSPGDFLIVMTPVGAERLTAPEVFTIEWRSGGSIGGVDIAYSESGSAGPFTDIALAETDDGVFDWSTDGLTTSPRYLIRIQDSGSTGAEGLSDGVFFVRANPDGGGDGSGEDVDSFERA